MCESQTPCACVHAYMCLHPIYWSTMQAKTEAWASTQADNGQAMDLSGSVHLPRRERRWSTRLPSCQVGLLSCLGLETQSPSTEIDAGQSTGPARGDRQTSRFGCNKYHVQLQLQMGSSNSPALEVLCGEVLGLQLCVLDQADTSVKKSSLWLFGQGYCLPRGCNTLYESHWHA